MPTPAYLDLALYLPAGGVNGFELNGHAVNGVGFVDSPFAGATFVLDDFRSIVVDERDDSDVSAVLATILQGEDRDSVQVLLETEAQLWAPVCESDVRSERAASEQGVDPVSLALEVEGVSMVHPEYRTAYVLADHPAETEHTRSDSDVAELTESQKQDEADVSSVPAEDRTTKVPR